MTSVVFLGFVHLEVTSVLALLFCFHSFDLHVQYICMDAETGGGPSPAERTGNPLLPNHQSISCVLMYMAKTRDNGCSAV